MKTRSDFVSNSSSCSFVLNYRAGEAVEAMLAAVREVELEWGELDDMNVMLTVHGEDGEASLRRRLKEAGADETRMEKFTDYAKLVEKLEKEPWPVFMLPNYTSMMELRQALSVKTGTKDFWE